MLRGARVQAELLRLRTIDQGRREAEAHWNRAFHLSEHYRLMHEAEAEHNLAMATRNLELIGKMAGVYSEGVSVSVEAIRAYSEAEIAEAQALARIRLEAGDVGEPVQIGTGHPYVQDRTLGISTGAMIEAGVGTESETVGAHDVDESLDSDAAEAIEPDSGQDTQARVQDGDNQTGTATAEPTSSVLPAPEPAQEPEVDPGQAPEPEPATPPPPRPLCASERLRRYMAGREGIHRGRSRKDLDQAQEGTPLTPQGGGWGP